MREIQISLEEFDLEAFVHRTADFMRECKPPEEEPIYSTVYGDRLGGVPIFVFNPEAVADALCALNEDGQIGFFPFAYTDDGERLTCADRIDYILFLVDIEYQYQTFIDPKDCVGYLVQIKDGTVIVNSAIQTYLDCPGCMPRIDFYPDCGFLEKAMDSFIQSFKYEKEAGTDKCGDCGCTEGELHVLGCDQERCPFCGGQLISCDCMYEILGLKDRSEYGPETDYLPPSIYENGLTSEQEEQWWKALNEKGRRSYIWWPILCARCGKVHPFFFFVPGEDWEKYIEPSERRKVVCRDCYLEIRRLIDAAEH